MVFNGLSLSWMIKITIKHCRTLKAISGWMDGWVMDGMDLRVVVGIEHLTVLIKKYFSQYKLGSYVYMSACNAQPLSRNIFILKYQDRNIVYNHNQVYKHKHSYQPCLLPISKLFPGHLLAWQLETKSCLLLNLLLSHIWSFLICGYQRNIISWHKDNFKVC